MRMIDIIAKKRNGETHTKEEISFLIKGITNGEIPDYQLSAWLMAVCFSGMDFEECSILTEEMAKSGDILDLSSIGDYVLDKHSTGGVGDKITLILIPLLAAAGMPVAKLSGRGLGHTGGTIDKLEAIPGFNANLSLDSFISQIKTIKAAIAGQTAKLAPADGKLYALRDVTATVDCLPLIASSVVSKKIASGANVIVLDVKYGNGAFVKTIEEAEKLSEIMVGIGKNLNRSITAVITSMDQPLGFAIGNSLEVIESVNVLKNQGADDLTELTLCLGAILLLNSKNVSSIEEGKKKLEKHIIDGSALEKLKEIIKTQNGDESVIDDTSKLATAKIAHKVLSPEEGYIKSLCAVDIAKACKILGAGRDKKEDKIDYSVGIILNKKVADKVEKGELLLTIYANDEKLVKEAEKLVNNAFTFSKEKIEKPVLIHKIIS
ncbi:MAG: thymidine phosphorylase [Candidatus Gastranaerophilaceae bacterium]|jgi:pyrimidine-nucleoside phosphorylase